MAGKEGTQAANVTGQTAGEKQQQANQSAMSNPKLAQLMSDYGSGKLSQQDALNQANQLGVDTGASGGVLQSALATSPAAAERFASDQQSSDPTMGKYFGAGGVQDQTLGAQKGLEDNLSEDRQDLKGKGEQYGLTDQDLKAYGQASGQAARMFGGQEQGLAQSLASRGLGGAASGSAGAQFSGLQGNKMEQLAGIQNQIAENRINTAKGLAEFRTQADAQQAQRNQQAGLQLGAMGQAGINANRSANLGEKGEAAGELGQAAQQQRASQQDVQSQNNIGFSQEQATRKKGFGEQLGDALSGAVAGGIGNLAASPFSAASGAINSVGKAAGGALADMM